MLRCVVGRAGGEDDLVVVNVEGRETREESDCTAKLNKPFSGFRATGKRPTTRQAFPLMQSYVKQPGTRTRQIHPRSAVPKEVVRGDATSQELVLHFVWVVVVLDVWALPLEVAHLWPGLFIYLLFIQLGARRLWRYRKEISINNSSKPDMRKQARKPDKGNPPPGRRLSQSIRAQLYKN